MQPGIVYVLSNPAMPDIVKVGITTRDQLKSRMRELFTTGLPFPFDCEYACRVDDCAKVESALHLAFDPDRVNPQREFFNTAPERIIAILKLLEKENIPQAATDDFVKDIDTNDIAASTRFKKARRPPLNFSEMGIPVGASLDFFDEESKISVVVTGAKAVQYQGKEYSLTTLTQELLHLDYAIQPTGKWYYQGKNLKEIYNQTYVV